MALHVTASDGKKEVALEVCRLSFGLWGSAAQCSLAAAAGLLTLSFLKGLLPVCQLTLWPSKEQNSKRGCGSYSEQNNGCVQFLLLCLVSVFTELRVTAKLPTGLSGTGLQGIRRGTQALNAWLEDQRCQFSH